MTALATSDFKLIGRGVYSIPEAERLTGIPRQRIRRWMEGYSYTWRGKHRRSPAVVASSIGRYAGPLSLTFSDLIEIRFLDWFLQIGLRWRDIRVAAERAKGILNLSHPFSSRRFKTDGRDVIAEIVHDGGSPEFLNLVKNQWEMAVVIPMLHSGLEFDEDEMPSMWWPLGPGKEVVIDPQRSFGAPIVAEGSVRTSILADAAHAERSQRAVARIYRVTPRAVRYAVAFERQRNA